jgi:hypothetical protein
MKKTIKLKEYDFIQLLKKVINEQDPSWTRNIDKPDQQVDIFNNEEKDLSTWEKWVKNYPNQCSNPKMVVEHPSIEGKSSKESLIENFCYYPFSGVNQNKGKIIGKWVPKESELNFWSNEGINSLVKVIIDNKNVSSFMSGFTDQDIKNIVSENLSVDTVSSFSFSGRKVAGWFTKTYDTFIPKEVKIKGYYYTDTKEPYVGPSWVDNRTLWDKLVDDYGLYVQLGTAAMFVVASIATGGLGGLALLAVELAVEGTLGAIIAQREWEKDNPLWWSEIIFGLTPGLKGTKLLRGITKAQVDDITKKMTDAGLNNSSTSEDVVRFYQSLSTDTEKMVFTILLKDTTDELSEATLKKLIGKQLTEETYAYVKKNPELLKDLSFLNKVWAKELGVNGLIMSFNLGYNTFFGKRLTDIQKKELEGIMLKMPEDVAKEVTTQILGSPENLELLYKNLGLLSDTIQGQEKLNNTIENGKAFNIVDSVMYNIGGIILDNPYVKNVDTVPDGYVELSDNEFDEFIGDIEDVKEVNGINYYLLKK